MVRIPVRETLRITHCAKFYEANRFSLRGSARQGSPDISRSDQFHALGSNQSESSTRFPVPFVGGVAVSRSFVAMAAVARKLQKLEENEKLIPEVERRPALWNIQSADYRNVHLKAALWDEVAAAVDSPGESREVQRQQLVGSFACV